MHLTFVRLAKTPRIFLLLTGLRVDEFLELAAIIEKDWELLIESQKKCHGRTSNLATFNDKLLIALMYYRTYTTHTFLGYLFGIHNSNVCRLLKKLEPLISNSLKFKKDYSLTPEAVLKLIVDATEHRTQRPESPELATLTYSGKKKCHTLKTEIAITEAGEIVHTSAAYCGSVHDFTIRKQAAELPELAHIYADSGYQGLQKLYKNVIIPIKRYKYKILTKIEKDFNKNLSSFRIKIEHKFREIKVFRIMSDCYRNFQQKHALRFNNIALIVNFKNGF
jgi:hypothetical protein